MMSREYEEQIARMRKREEARARRGGWRLAVYNWEYETYRPFYSHKVGRHGAAVLLRKFSRHFKTSCPILTPTIKRRGGGHYIFAFYSGARITLGKDPSLAIVCHEYAHHLTHIRHPENKKCHSKVFKRELKKVYTFAKRYLPKEKATEEVAIPYAPTVVLTPL